MACRRPGTSGFSSVPRATDVDGDEVRALAEQAARQLQQAILSTEGALPETWTPADRAAALGAATIILAHLPSRAADAEGILRTALSAEPAPPDDWKQSAVAGLIVALAVQEGRSAGGTGPSLRTKAGGAPAVAGTALQPAIGCQAPPAASAGQGWRRSNWLPSSSWGRGAGCCRPSISAASTSSRRQLWRPRGGERKR
jgi:hypothetical protein